jgi:2-polyprenyl-3-methyl-5-hydroxy-6-metoxy-1,4-benzoquinol methylase
MRKKSKIRTLSVMQEFWNERYAADEFVYGKSPNLFFKKQIDKLTPGKILLPADGEGRNSVYAARQGWEATAIDYSKSAKEKALKLANEAGVSIQYHLNDLASYDFGENEYDATALVYVHLPRSIIETVYSNIIKSVKPGGTIIAEVYSLNQLGKNSGGPKDERVLYSVEKLEHLLAGTKIQFLKEMEVELNEGKHHIGTASVIRAVAEVLE